MSPDLRDMLSPVFLVTSLPPMLDWVMSALLPLRSFRSDTASIIKLLKAGGVLVEVEGTFFDVGLYADSL